MIAGRRTNTSTTCTCSPVGSSPRTSPRRGARRRPPRSTSWRASTAVEGWTDQLVFGKALVPRLTGDTDTKAGRLGQGLAKPGQSAPWVLDDPTDDDIARADKFAGRFITELPSGDLVLDAQGARHRPRRAVLMSCRALRCSIRRRRSVSVHRPPRSHRLRPVDLPRRARAGVRRCRVVPATQRARRAGASQAAHRLAQVDDVPAVRARRLPV